MASNALDVHVQIQNGGAMVFQMQGLDTIRTLCREVSMKLGVEENGVRVRYTGKILDRSNSLSYLGVRPETVLKVETAHRQSYTLHIKPEEGPSFPVHIGNFETIAYLKQQIEVVNHIAPTQQILKLKGCSLENVSHSLFSVGINDGVSINLSKKSEITESAAVPESSAQKKPDVQLSEDEKETVINSFHANGRPVEVVFCFDTTGSMASCIQEVRKNLRLAATELLQNVGAIRIGIMAHGDYCDQSVYVTRHVDLTADVDALVQFASGVPSTGGGDYPECYEWALRKAQQMDWSDNAAKALVMIGDAVPHPTTFTNMDVCWMEEVDVLAGLGVKVYGVQAMNNHDATYFYREIAERSGGAYVKLNNFAVITEMFLAVCYREASNEQYEQYCQEVTEGQDETEARSSTFKEDVKSILQQLKKDDQKHQQRQSRPPKPLIWWGRNGQSVSSPQYVYNQETDFWSPSSRNHTSPPILSTIEGSSTDTSRKHSRKRFTFKRTAGDSKIACNVM